MKAELHKDRIVRRQSCIKAELHESRIVQK